MPNSKRKNVEKARVFNNLKLNFPEQPREAETIAVGENCIQELGCRKANQRNNETDDPTVDNDISAFSLITWPKKLHTKLEIWKELCAR